MTSVDKLSMAKENERRIKAVEELFGTSGKVLYIPGRVLVGEGVLKKMCRKKLKPRQFFLFNDVLVYGNIVIENIKLSKQTILPLREISVHSLPDTIDTKNGWQIRSNKKSFAVYAMTSQEKTEWMNHITNFAQAVRRSKGIPEVCGEQAAVWVPDKETTHCMVCSESKFTALNRRHHCRHCGKVVCEECSKTRLVLPHISDKPVRVCSPCFRVLGLKKKTSGPIDLGNQQQVQVLEVEASSDDEEETENAGRKGTSQSESTEQDETDDRLMQQMNTRGGRHSMFFGEEGVNISPPTGDEQK